MRQGGLCLHQRDPRRNNISYKRAEIRAQVLVRAQHADRRHRILSTQRWQKRLGTWGVKDEGETLRSGCQEDGIQETRRGEALDNRETDTTPRMTPQYCPTPPSLQSNQKSFLMMNLTNHAARTMIPDTIREITGFHRMLNRHLAKTQRK